MTREQMEQARALCDRNPLSWGQMHVRAARTLLPAALAALEQRDAEIARLRRLVSGWMEKAGHDPAWPDPGSQVVS